MSPTPSPSFTHLRHQIASNLDADLPDTANFLAARLYALEPRNPDCSHLLALTYLRLRRYRAAYDFAQKYGANGRHLGCAYVFAHACLHLGDSSNNAAKSYFVEGATALEKAKPTKLSSQESTTRRLFIPDAAAIWTLQARLLQAHGDLGKAGECYIRSHKADPFIWEAFEGLCKIGADLNVAHMFKAPAADTGGAPASNTSTERQQGGVGDTDIFTDEPQRQDSVKPLAAQPNFNQQVFTPSADPFANSRTGTEVGAQFNVKGKSTLANGIKAPLSGWDTPTNNGDILEEDVSMGGVMVDNDSFAPAQQPPAAPARRTRPGQQFEASDRPRQPPLRGHGHQSASEGIAEEAVPVAPRRPTLGGHKRTISGQTSQANPVAIAADASQQPTRRSNRLFGQSSTTMRTSIRTATDSTASMAGRGERDVASRPAKTATGAKGRIGSTVGRVVSGNRKMLPPDRNAGDKEKEREKRAPSRNSEKGITTAAPAVTSAVLAKQQQPPPQQPQPLPTADTSRADREAISNLLDGLRDLAIGAYATSRFETPLALRTFRALPVSQRETPWVLSHIARAHYEAADYKNAEEFFARALRLQPSRIEDMEVYSTVLWHLKKDAALAFLSHTLRATASQAPQTWVAAGNAFSLSREHDQAIAAFRRAVQIDPSFAYAWTLMGHEHIANEDFDAALASFRTAVAVERRGYGGWYGLGKCFERIGRLDEAERHYRVAASINPANSTLLVCIGVVLERLRNKKGALANYSRALELSPASALARFKKARVLMHLRHFDGALLELEVLRDQAPDEANVWFLLGKCYKGLGERGEALRALTTALNLDVKVSWCAASSAGKSNILTMFIGCAVH